ncbi:Cupredoxin [Artemisia annua]|uniref:Cupredoxin n=1 Tax=Artemisia annua TaxID=35608 RepID=A0A2U1LCV1_ARTAN|nr:Cupredoxin [Artemisia annua]
MHVLVLLLLAALCCYIPTQAALVRYTFMVQETNYTRLCSSKNILTVNGQYPGPNISARRGDIVIVDVINQDTIIRFSKKIILSDEEGTLWWHAHND